MKSWKDYPHLFSNGKFRVKIIWVDGMTEIVSLYVIDGIPIADFNKNSGGEFRKFPYKFVGLIARKIDSLTDEEYKNMPSYTTQFSYDFTIKWLKKYWNEILITDFLYLLSIGVYPFDQSHFETGEVIDIKTL